MDRRRPNVAGVCDIGSELRKMCAELFSWSEPEGRWKYAAVFIVLDLTD